jgi:pimeloyl-ACP methyl ester carboxylesterase
MPLRHCSRPLAAILIATLLTAAWSSGLETVELDGYRATFDPDQSFTVTEGDLDCTPFGGPATVRVTETLGRLGEADYLIYRPADWNGDLVLWAHGMIEPLFPDGAFWLAVPTDLSADATKPPDHRTFLAPRAAIVCHGFGMAASAFTRHGVAIAEGMRDTHLLQVIAPHHLGADPEKTYVAGSSMGGNIAIALAERFPGRYAGVLLDRGAASMLYLGTSSINVRVLLDAFYPGLLEAQPLTDHAMSPDEFATLVAVLQDRVQADPTALQRMASLRLPGSAELDPAGIGVPLLTLDPHASDPQAAFVSLVGSLAQQLALYLFTVDDIRERGRGGFAFGNRHEAYDGFDWTAEAEADLNARVARFDADPWALRYWTFNYEPSGELEIPLVSFRTTHDTSVSVAHEWLIARALERTGASDLHATWLIERYGHGTTPQEFATALLGLVEWVETGVRPTWPTP